MRKFVGTGLGFSMLVIDGEPAGMVNHIGKYIDPDDMLR